MKELFNDKNIRVLAKTMQLSAEQQFSLDLFGFLCQSLMDVKDCAEVSDLVNKFMLVCVYKKYKIEFKDTTKRPERKHKMKKPKPRRK